MSDDDDSFWFLLKKKNLNPGVPENLFSSLFVVRLK